jgi:ATP-binding cassette subfamily B protein/subfamily B ATP-binding cassette protein MsbA
MTVQRHLEGWKKYRRLLGYPLADWRGWVGIFALTLLSGAALLLQPWPMQILVDHVLGQEPLAGLLAWVAAVLPGGQTARGLLVWVVLAGLALFALASALDVVLTNAWIRVGQKMAYRLAGDLFAHIQRRSLLFHSRNSVGDSMSRITGDAWCAYKVVDTLLLAPMQALILSAGMVVLMAQVDLGLTLLAVIVAPFMAGTSFWTGRRLRWVARARREIESGLQAHVQRTLSGIQVVQSFTQEQREQQRLEELTAAARRAQRRNALVGSCCNLLSGLMLCGGTAAVLWVGAGHVLTGRLSLGSLLVFLAYLTSLQGQLKAFTEIYGTLQETAASIDRVVEMLEADLEVQDRPGAVALPAVAGAVGVEDVGFGYEAGRPVLQGVSLEARPGQTVAIVGPSGAGKTTLVSLIARFFDPWQGCVRIDGKDVREVQLQSLRRQIGLVLQEPFLFPLTVAENIAYGRPGASRSEIEAAARAANLHDFIAALPGGYDTVLGQRGATWSGGEQQRLAIARALLRNPRILILDEPTSALDAHTEKLVLEALRRLMQGRTTFVIGHRLSTVRRADQIVVLQDGRVTEMGTHPELLARQGAYARFHQLQCGPPAQPVSRVG